ncbi:dolichol-phosphate mannosyltransferase [Sphingomonas jinjuensis]|uniref:Dolichol-phosphate mannosyltransferase n=1 Tax=Sphingomonas jinjuensis TaxID=535907 RepID=A0A840FH10_9SPHN|nr:dolichol-phosphate mannosyltransferase [Sphingomonas jinjuensis]
MNDMSGRFLADALAVAPPQAPAMLPADLAIVVPAFNEVANIDILVAAIDRALEGVRWEVVIVDDNSPDGTAAHVREVARRDPRVRLLHRYGRRGLSSACVEGIQATTAPVVAVMDADMQHDERILAAMFARIGQGDVDLVVGSRYVEGGGIGDWSKGRAAMSRLATRLATRLTRTPISDPMSGFFMLRRDAFLAALPGLSSVGFKILLDIAASSPKPLRVAEVPYTFRLRQHGESKLDALVLWDYLQLLIDKMIGHLVPVRFVSFAMVGMVGVAVHFAVLTTLYKAFGTSFSKSQVVATLVATSSNFFLNNVLTYRDQRLKGFDLLTGWISFNIVCVIGALANVGVARWLFVHQSYWVLSALAGVAVTTVWNYAMSAVFTWRRRRRIKR